MKCVIIYNNYYLGISEEVENSHKKPSNKKEKINC